MSSVSYDEMLERKVPGCELDKTYDDAINGKCSRRACMTCDHLDSGVWMEYWEKRRSE